MPPQSAEVHYEGELAVVIGRLCKDVPEEQVGEVVYGYTCANDVTARDLQNRDGQWTRAKGFDTFCPIGPWIETDLDVTDLALTTRLRRRDGAAVAHLAAGPPGRRARRLRLRGDDAAARRRDPDRHAGRRRPGEAGQRVEVEIEGIGVLSNPFVARG